MAASPYGYPWADWLAREDPAYAAARAPVSALSTGEGKELSVPGGGPTLSAGVKGLMQLETEGAFKRG